MKNGNMRKLIFSAVIAAAVFMLVAGSSCKARRERKIEQNDPGKAFDPDQLAKMDTIYNAEYEARGFSKATITDNTGLDGCTFLLTLNTGQKLIPLNLKKEFMKDKMLVWVNYKKEDAMTVCMAGEAVRIIEIAVRK
jgi:hypothetical protein